MRKQGWWGFAFTLPFTVQFLVFILFPFLFSIYLTFTKWDFFNPIQWVGLENWVTILKSPPFWISLRNIIFFVLVFVPLQTFVSLVFAHLLNQKIGGKRIFQAAFFLPAVTPWVAAGFVWTWMYNGQFGIINWVLSLVHIPKVDWLSGDWWLVIGAIALVQAWKGIGESFVLLLAAMQNVSNEVIEAARIDGASGWTIFFRIVFPSISPMIFFVLILSSTSAFKAFDSFLVMLGTSAVAEEYNIPNLMVYQEAFKYYHMGLASTVGWLMFVVIMLFTMFQLFMEKRWVHYE